MIKYNFRYRGPYEEDKFALSILNFANEVNDALEEVESKKIYNNILKKYINKHNINKSYIELYRKGAN